MSRHLLIVLSALLVAAGCTREDPARTALRQLITTQQASLSPEDLTRFREEISRSLTGKQVRIKVDAALTDLTEEQRTTVLSMLTEPTGLFDEGLRQESGTTYRILNAPGASEDAEIEATRRLWIDPQTFLPRRFEFAYAAPGLGDYSYELEVR